MGFTMLKQPKDKNLSGKGEFDTIFLSWKKIPMGHKNEQTWNLSYHDERN